MGTSFFKQRAAIGEAAILPFFVLAATGARMSAYCS
jgi:hypothetical protein